MGCEPCQRSEAEETQAVSNIGNVFGNESWIQASIDRSRGKTRPGAKRRKAARQFASRRDAALASDPLIAKHGGDPNPPKQKLKKGLGGMLQRAMLKAKAKQNDPLIEKYGG